MVTRMLLRTVAASMLGAASAEPRTNGFAGVAVVSAEVPLAPGDGASGEAGDGAVAPVRELDEGIPAAVLGLSLWLGLAAVWDSLGGATKKYHTTPATAQASSIARSHFLIEGPQPGMVAGRTELGGHRWSSHARHRFI
jgi:hypothetical protein